MPASQKQFYLAPSLADAVAALAERGPGGAPLAGATWLMRAPLRGEPPRAYVALSRIGTLKDIAVSARSIRVGACVTHAELAKALTPLADCRVLAEAAGHSANPAVREMATVGGNLCTAGFAAADLVPALLCLDAEVDLLGPDGEERLSLADFLARRPGLAPGCLLTRVIVPRAPRRSAHARLPLRRAGDYPVAIVSLAVTLDRDRIAGARVAVGAVEAVGRRWERLERSLIGQPLDARVAADLARASCDAFQARDGVEAPGWYRRAVLPTLVSRAVDAARA